MAGSITSHKCLSCGIYFPASVGSHALTVTIMCNSEMFFMCSLLSEGSIIESIITHAHAFIRILAEDTRVSGNPKLNFIYC